MQLGKTKFDQEQDKKLTITPGDHQDPHIHLKNPKSKIPGDKLEGDGIQRDTDRYIHSSTNNV